MDAPWKTGLVIAWWGSDAEGQARGFTWCALCGTETLEGVVVKMSGKNSERGTAFFCADCVEKMHQAAQRKCEVKA